MSAEIKIDWPKVPYPPEYRAAVSAAMKAVFAEKRRLGKFCGGHVPYGYRRTDDDYLVPDPAEQAVLTRIRELRATGVTYQTIADVLNVDGFKTRNGKPFEMWRVFHFAKRSLAVLS